MTRSAAGYDVDALDPAERDKLAAGLTPEERRILLDHGTEQPGCGLLLHNKEPGAYVCRLCGLPLFASKDKFDSGTGWPSFSKSYDPDHVHYLVDDTLGMRRTEIRCKRCDSHLGHVFEDGPAPTGKRYCLNSIAMEFVTDDKPLPKKTKSDQA